MRLRVVAAVLLALLGVTTSASGRQDTSLPRFGIAVETGRGVNLLALDGRVLRTLSGFRIRFSAVERPGQIQLRDRSGQGYELRPGVLARTPADTVTLAGGYALRFRARWSLLRDGRTLQVFPRFTRLELDDTGTVLTSIRVREDGRAVTAPVARNLRTGALQRLPASCRVAIQRPRVRFELCGYPYLKRRVSTIVRVDEGGRRTLASPALRAAHGPAGWWRSVTLSAAGDRLLAQWSGECEIPYAYVIHARSGRATVLGRDGRGGQAEALTLGWARGEAIVMLPRGACGSSAERPGVYAFDARGRARLIIRVPDARPPLSAALWR